MYDPSVAFFTIYIWANCLESYNDSVRLWVQIQVCLVLKPLHLRHLMDWQFGTNPFIPLCDDVSLFYLMFQTWPKLNRLSFSQAHSGQQHHTPLRRSSQKPGVTSLFSLFLTFPRLSFSVDSAKQNARHAHIFDGHINLGSCYLHNFYSWQKIPVPYHLVQNWVPTIL